MRKKYLNYIKKFCKIFFYVYLVILLWKLFKISGPALGNIQEIYENRKLGFWNLNLMPLETIVDSIKFSNYSTMILNIIAFIPLGFLYPFAINENKKILTYILHFLVFDLLIEIVQFITMIGFFDIDDVLLNMLGFLQGIILYYIIKYIDGLFFIQEKNNIQLKGE